ncbi:MAG: DNA replication/repair protein RecF [Patescibacteria group bacterium]
MKINSLRLENFRNFAKLELTFAENVAAFVGANARGKTNILEAISLLAFGKSLRANSEQSLRKIGTDFFRIEAVAKNGTGEKLKIEIAATATAKNLKLNGKKITASELVGQLPIVSFAPEDLNLLLLEPSRRRKYLDILLSQTSREYLHALGKYTKALKNRNALLTRIAENLARENELEFWDRELAESGALIGKMRAEFLEFATEPLAQNFGRIANEPKKLTFRIANFRGEEISSEKYLENLEKMRAKDLRFGTTNYGVHRADLVFELNGELLSENGSRGEIRSSVLALKFVELKFLEEKLAEKPILLLDDVFSELDASRQESLMNLIAHHQTFLTTTKLGHLDPIAKKEVWEIKNNSAKKI